MGAAGHQVHDSVPLPPHTMPHTGAMLPPQQKSSILIRFLLSFAKIQRFRYLHLNGWFSHIAGTIQELLYW